jgi:hypothetical protein
MTGTECDTPADGYQKCLFLLLSVGEVRRGKTAKREMEQVNAIGGWLRMI